MRVLQVVLHMRVCVICVRACCAFACVSTSMKPVDIGVMHDPAS